MTDSETGRTTTYYYDFIGRNMKYVESGNGYNHSVGYEYDEKNMLTSMVETINGKEKTTSYTYDNDDRITSVTNGNASKSYTYDSYGRTSTLTTKHNGTTVKTDTFDFMPRGTTNQTSSQIKTHTVNIGSINTVYTYTYDANGNITKITYGSYEIAYTYDAANQLTGESNSRMNWNHAWTYDNAGNIKTHTITNRTTGAAVAAYEYEHGQNGWGDLLTSIKKNGTVSNVSYDPMGNMLTDGTRTFTWKHGRQLDTLTMNGVTWTYTYDANGMRTSRTSSKPNSTESTRYEYVYNGSSLTQMTILTTDANGNTTTQVVDISYDASGTPLTLTYTPNGSTTGTTYYYVTNIQGDVTGLTDTTGKLIISYFYTGYGETYVIKHSSENDNTADILSAVNPLCYRGYVLDTQTKLYYLQSRYYNPEIGRFISSDMLVSTGQGLLGNNMLAYCLNNPVNRSDPSGTSSSSGHNIVEPWNCTCVDCFSYSSSAWGIAADAAVTILSISSTGLIMVGTINNSVNFIYYTWISDGESSLELDENYGSYINTYISRWDRLDYTKQQTGDSVYGYNAWRYNSEYSLHAYGWYMIEPFYKKGSSTIDRFGKSLEKAHMYPHEEDTVWQTRLLTYLFGLTGL